MEWISFFFVLKRLLNSKVWCEFSICGSFTLQIWRSLALYLRTSLAQYAMICPMLGMALKWFLEKNRKSRKTFIWSQNLISVCEEFCNPAPLLKSSVVDFFSKPRVLRAQVAWNYLCEQRKSVNNTLSKITVWLRSVPPLERSPLRK